LLDAAEIANAQLNTVGQLIGHAALRQRDRWRTVGTPNGPVDALLPPINLSGAAPRMDPVPDLGEHTRSVLAEIGLDPEERLPGSGELHLPSASGSI
jgi:itaconate CoA-transferase